MSKLVQLFHVQLCHGQKSEECHNIADDLARAEHVGETAIGNMYMEGNYMRNPFAILPSF